MPEDAIERWNKSSKKAKFKLIGSFPFFWQWWWVAKQMDLNRIKSFPRLTHKIQQKRHRGIANTVR